MSAVFPPKRVVLPRPERRLLFAASPECSLYSIALLAQGPTSGTWPSINDPVAIPFCLPYGGVVTELATENGSAAGGNVDIGIYDTSFARLVSTGSQASVGSSIWQWFNVTDTALPPGRYYLAMSRDDVTANRQRFLNMGASAPVAAFCGVLDSATDAFPLPNPLTNMAAAATFTRAPMFAIGFRTHYA